VTSVEPQERLQDLISQMGGEPYLVTVTGEGRPHCSIVTVACGVDGLVVAAPRHWTTPEDGAPGHVTLLWPPAAPGGYTLIVDGVANTAGDGRALTIVPTRAVWHRRGADASPAGSSWQTAAGSSCQSDCMPIL
jgi:hypothetical protein